MKTQSAPFQRESPLRSIPLPAPLHTCSLFLWGDLLEHRSLMDESNPRGRCLQTTSTGPHQKELMQQQEICSPPANVNLILWKCHLLASVRTLTYTLQVCRWKDWFLGRAKSIFNQVVSSQSLKGPRARPPQQSKEKADSTQKLLPHMPGSVNFWMTFNILTFESRP